MSEFTIDKIDKLLKPFVASGIIAREDFLDVIKAVRDRKAVKNLPVIPPKDEQLLTQDQLAKRWQICKTQVRKREKDGFIRRVAGMVGHPRYRFSDIVRYEEGGK